MFGTLLLGKVLKSMLTTVRTVAHHDLRKKDFSPFYKRIVCGGLKTRRNTRETKDYLVVNIRFLCNFSGKS